MPPVTHSDREPWQLTAADARERLSQGSLAPLELVDSCLDRSDAREPAVRAWAHRDPALVRARAGALRAGLASGAPRGALYGLPVGIKDVFGTVDMPTRYNSPLYDDPPPTADAACVAILRAAGAVIFGKTGTVEFGATGHVAATRNPHDPQRTPGGSSSGSAAAVADGHVPLALGTQTGGSIVRPASYCGVFGMKPTWGFVSREGARPFAPSLDTIGWFARCVADLRLLYDVFDPEPASREPFALAGARIALCRTPVWARAETATIDALAQAERVLRAAGAQVEPLELPGSLAELGPLHGLIMRAEARASFLAEYRVHGEALHPSLRGYVQNGERYRAAELIAAYDLAAVARADFDALATPFDAVLTPSVTGEAPSGLAHTGDYVFNALWSLLHTPCVNVPVIKGPHGMPVGITLTAARSADRQVLAVAETLASLLPPPAFA